MRTHVNRRRALLALVLALALAAGACSSDDGGDSDASAATTSAPTTAPADDPAESAYCDAAREWAIQEVTQPVDETDPAAFEAYWGEFEAFEQVALENAPDELREDWQRKVDTEDETIDVVLEAYDYDLAALQAHAVTD